MVGFMDADLNLIVFYESTSCACRVNNLQDWAYIMDYSREMGQKFNTIFIFSPTQSGYNQLRISLRASQTGYPMFIDFFCDFLKMNPIIPAKSDHSHLSVGQEKQNHDDRRPLNNGKLGQLYKEQIQALLKP